MDKQTNINELKKELKTDNNLANVDHLESIYRLIIALSEKQKQTQILLDQLITPPTERSSFCTPETETADSSRDSDSHEEMLTSTRL